MLHRIHTFISVVNNESSRRHTVYCTCMLIRAWLFIFKIYDNNCAYERKISLYLYIYIRIISFYRSVSFDNFYIVGVYRFKHTFQIIDTFYSISVARYASLAKWLSLWDRYGNVYRDVIAVLHWNDICPSCWVRIKSLQNKYIFHIIFLPSPWNKLFKQRIVLQTNIVCWQGCASTSV